MTDKKNLCKWLVIAFLLTLVMFTPLGNWFIGAFLVVALIMTAKYLLF